MKGLKELVTEIDYLVKAGDIDGKSGGIHTTSNDACIYKGMPPFNQNLEYGELPLYYSRYPYPKLDGMKVKEMYTYGVPREMHSWYEERVLYPEWHDRVTLFFWKCTKDSDSVMIENLESYQSYLDTHEIDGIKGEILEKLKEKFEEKNE